MTSYFPIGQNLDFIITESCLILIQNISNKIIHISDTYIRNVKGRIYSLPLNLHKHQSHVQEQHSKSYVNFGQQVLRLSI